MNVSKLINLSLKQLGVLAAGENANANEVADAVDSLRAMLAQWATHRLYVYKVEKISIVLNGAGQYSLNQTIHSISDSAKLDDEPILMIRDTNQSKPNTKVVYSVDEPFWKFNVLTDAKVLEVSAFTLPVDLDAQDDLQLPDKYERPLILSLALEIAPMFGVEPSMLLIKNQDNAIEMLKRSNSVPRHSNNDLPVGVGRTAWRL